MHSGVHLHVFISSSKQLLSIAQKVQEIQLQHVFIGIQCL